MFSSLISSIFQTVAVTIAALHHAAGTTVVPLAEVFEVVVEAAAAASIMADVETTSRASEDCCLFHASDGNKKAQVLKSVNHSSWQSTTI